jgi:hypothetical protein
MRVSLEEGLRRSQQHSSVRKRSGGCVAFRPPAMSQQQVGPPGAGRGRGMTLPAWMTGASLLFSALQFRSSRV